MNIKESEIELEFDGIHMVHKKDNGNIIKSDHLDNVMNEQVMIGTCYVCKKIFTLEQLREVIFEKFPKKRPLSLTFDKFSKENS